MLCRLTGQGVTDKYISAADDLQSAFFNKIRAQTGSQRMISAVNDNVCCGVMPLNLSTVHGARTSRVFDFKNSCLVLSTGLRKYLTSQSSPVALGPCDSAGTPWQIRFPVTATSLSWEMHVWGRYTNVHVGQSTCMANLFLSWARRARI
jgi:hypothetical protein